MRRRRDARVQPGTRFVDNGRIITAAGISAGIDAALHVVGRLLGTPVAEETARYMEYRWERGPYSRSRLGYFCSRGQ